MCYQAKNGKIAIDSGTMDYISFGTGSKTLIMIPGVGDGLKTVRGMAAFFAMLYRQYAKGYRVYVFSRRNDLKPGHSTRAMAADLAMAMEQLHIEKASVLGISQGGMIAQYLAIDHPQVVDKLILAVTTAGPNEILRERVGCWLKMAETGDYKGIMIDTAEHSYTEKKLKRYRLLYPFLNFMGKPKDFSRFLIQAEACLSHDARGRLQQITCPTLIIGGDCDEIVGREAAAELAAQIAGSRLFVYEGLGHGAYEEAKDFHQRVLDFLEEMKGITEHV